MAYRIEKNKDTRDFKVEYNRNQGLLIQDGAELVDGLYLEFTYALLPNEIMFQEEVEIDVPEYDEQGEIIGTRKEPVTLNYPIINPNFEDEEKAKEEARIAQLNMTRGDFIEGLILAQGKDEKDIIVLIEALPINEIEKKVYINRVNNALDFYRGYPVIDVLCEFLNVPLENMDKFFETKDYNYLKPVVNPDPSDENENIVVEDVEGNDVPHNDPNVTQDEEVADGE